MISQCGAEVILSPAWDGLDQTTGRSIRPETTYAALVDKQSV